MSRVKELSETELTPHCLHPGLISFRMDWLDLLAVQGTLKSLLHPPALSLGFLTPTPLHSFSHSPGWKAAPSPPGKAGGGRACGLGPWVPCCVCGHLCDHRGVCVCVCVCETERGSGQACCLLLCVLSALSCQGLAWQDAPA